MWCTMGAPGHCMALTSRPFDVTLLTTLALGSKRSTFCGLRINMMFTRDVFESPSFSEFRQNCRQLSCRGYTCLSWECHTGLLRGLLGGLWRSLCFCFNLGGIDIPLWTSIWCLVLSVCNYTGLLILHSIAKGYHTGLRYLVCGLCCISQAATLW